MASTPLIGRGSLVSASSPTMAKEPGRWIIVDREFRQVEG
jgi:hypothetical protein